MFAFTRVLVRGLIALAAVLLLAHCASTQVEARWSDPAIAGKPLGGKVMVVGVARDEAVRRLYEDEMAARLAQRGVEPIRSYEHVPAPLLQDGSTAILNAAKQAGAAFVLSSAVVGRMTEQQVITDPLPTWGLYYDRWYGHYWGLTYTRTEVRSFERLFANTTLTETGERKILWSVRTRTDSPAAVEQEVKAFAKLIVGELVRTGLLRE